MANNTFQSVVREKSLLVAIVLLRWMAGAVFIFSGFTKGIDLWGVMYKIDDYLNAFGWHWALSYSGFVSIVLTTVEFVTGVMLFIGSFRRVTVIVALAMMAFMLPLTAYIAIYNPVPDCGCFGEALVISNTATFWKNVVLTAVLCFLLWKNKTVRSLYGPAVQWLTALFSTVYILIIIATGYFTQPLLDFRPYKIGTFLTGNNKNYIEFRFLYEKGGQQQWFDLENLPDSTWTFIEREESAHEENNSETVNNIAIFDGDTDVTNDVLPTEGEAALLLIPDIADINVASTFKINELYEYLSESGINMICLTGGTDSDIVEWKEISMANYPVYKMDDTTLKTIARGNPAFVRLKDGMILWKSALDSITVDDITSQDNVAGNGMGLLFWLTSIFILLMVLLLIVNRTPLLIKFTVRLKKNRKKK